MNAFENYLCEVIRPLRASSHRKARMWEELLGHLNEARAERAAAGVSSELLDEETLRHFGPPDQLRRRLEESVPRFERATHFRLLERRDGETDFRYATRCAGWATAFVMIQAICVIAAYSPSHMPTGPCVVVLAGALVFEPIFMFGAFLWNMRNQRHLGTGRTGRAAAEAAVYSLAIAAIPFTICIYLSRTLPGMGVDMAMVTAYCVLGAALLTATIVTMGRYTARHFPWIEMGRNL